MVIRYIFFHSYCRSGNICEVFIFANFARKTNSRIQESREYLYYNSTVKKNINLKLREKAQNQNFARI